MHRVSIALIAALIPSLTNAQDLTILVAPRDTPAYVVAQDQENDTTFAERRIHRAFNRAAEHMANCGACTVTIKLAAGAYDGRGGTGMWTVPEIVAPDATLHILGGWDDAFQDRAPFETPTLLVSTQERSGPVLQFEGRRPAMAELVVSGLVFDTSPSNAYDGDSNALMKSGSSTWGQLSLGYFEMGHLVIADNVFMNAPAGVAAPQFRTPDSGLRMDIQNNIFFNSVTPWTIPGGVSDSKPEEIAIRGNSFVLNWPRNPDPTTSNPGTLEIGNNYAAEHVLIEANIFAWNMGGAIFSQWDHDRSPDLTIRENLFWQNGFLFGASSEDTGVMVGKFNGAATHSIYDAYDLEDDFDWLTEDNESFDPGFGLDIPDLKAVQYGSEYRGADVAADGSAGDGAEIDAASQVQVDDFAARLSAFSVPDSGEGDEVTADGNTSTIEIVGPDNSIRNYAPRLTYAEVGIPMPRSADAAEFGASQDRIWRAE